MLTLCSLQCFCVLNHTLAVLSRSATSSHSFQMDYLWGRGHRNLGWGHGQWGRGQGTTKTFLSERFNCFLKMSSQLRSVWESLHWPHLLLGEPSSLEAMHCYSLG